MVGTILFSLFDRVDYFRLGADIRAEKRLRNEEENARKMDRSDKVERVSQRERRLSLTVYKFFQSLFLARCFANGRISASIERSVNSEPANDPSFLLWKNFIRTLKCA